MPFVPHEHDETVPEFPTTLPAPYVPLDDIVVASEVKPLFLPTSEHAPSSYSPSPIGGHKNPFKPLPNAKPRADAADHSGDQEGHPQPLKKLPPEKPARPNPPQKPPKPTVSPAPEPIPISVVDTNPGHHASSMATHSNSNASLPSSPHDPVDQSPRARPARPMKEPPKIGVEHSHSTDRSSISTNSEDDRSSSSEMHSASTTGLPATKSRSLVPLSADASKDKITARSAAELNKRSSQAQMKLRTTPITLEEFNESFPLTVVKLDFKVFDQMRDKLIYEFYTTELTYVNNLRIMKEFWNPAILFMTFGDVEEDNHLNKLKASLTPLFRTVTEILGVNEMLLTELNEKITKWSNEQKIGEFLVTMVSLFKMYGNYSRHYNEAQNAIQHAEAKSPSYKEKIGLLATDPLCKTLPFTGYLIQPIQRLPRYVMLLEGIIKNTDASHVDYKNLTVCLEKFKEKATEVNDSINQAENQRKCLEIQKMFGSSTGGLAIFQANRRFMLEGNLVKQCRKERKHRSDILIYGYETPKTIINGEIVFSQGLLLSTMNCTDPNLASALESGDSAPSPVDKMIEISSPGKSFLIFCDTDAEKKTWFNTLNQCILEEKKKIAEKKRAENNAHLKTLNIEKEMHKDEEELAMKTAPKWMPDDMIHNCQVCSEKFTFYFRKHHCRNCGSCVCSNCSNNKAMLVHVNKNAKERVCTKCFKELTEVKL